MQLPSPETSLEHESPDDDDDDDDDDNNDDDDDDDYLPDAMQQR